MNSCWSATAESGFAKEDRNVTHMRPIAFIGLVLMLVSCAAAADTPLSQLSTPSPGQDGLPRAIVIISDLHFGVGKVNGAWNNLEDFRWPNALRAFLNMTTARYNHSVDLVVAGDL